MKPLFAIDLTDDIHNDKMNAEAFIAKQLVTSKPGGISELRFVGSDENEKPEVKEEKPLTRREKRALKKRLRDEEYYDEKTKRTIALRSALHKAYADVGVPDDADDVDIFSFSYIVRNGEMITVIPDGAYTDYVNLPMKMYVKNRKLYLSDLTRAYAFKLDSMKSIVKVKKKIVFPFWHREMPHDDSLYSPFEIKYKKFRRVYVAKYYYILTLCENGEEYQIMFPPYDLFAFERLAEINCERKKRRR